MKTTVQMSEARRATVMVRAAARARRHDRTAVFDARWPELVVNLSQLRERGRRAVRIVDADCGNGTMLIEAVRHARGLGFTAIEGRGIDDCAGSIARARALANRLRDPAIGLVFEAGDARAALAEEAELPADVVLWRGSGRHDRCPAMLQALARAGDVVIRDPIVADWRRAA